MILSRRYKIKSARIEEIKKRGRIFRSLSFLVILLKDSGFKNPHFAFIISKKISKKAVVRNKIKRILSEAVRRSLYLVPENFDFIFLAKKGIEKRTQEEIFGEVEKFLKNLNDK